MQKLPANGLILVLIILTAPQPALSSPPMEIYGPAGTTAPFNGLLPRTGPSLAYSNPAGLSYSEGVIDVSLAYHTRNLSIDYKKRPDSADISENIYRARRRTNNGSEPLSKFPTATRDLSRRRGAISPGGRDTFLALGYSDRFLDNRIGAGLYAMLPVGALQTQNAFFVDEKAQYFSNSLHFARYDNRMNTYSVSGAVSGRPLDDLSLGAGLTMVNSATTKTSVFLPDIESAETMPVRAKTEIHNSFIPLFALQYNGLPRVRLAGTVHFESFNRVSGNNEVQVWSGTETALGEGLKQSFQFRHDYLPLRATAAASYCVTKTSECSLDVSVSGKWADWSSYVPRQTGQPIGTWRDTVSGSLGLTGKLDRHRGHLGVEFEPSPVLEQRGRTNYVDNDRLSTSLGWKYTVATNTPKISVTLQAQGHRLLHREHQKSGSASNPVVDEFPTSVDAKSGETIDSSKGLQTNNPGYPGFESDGWIVGSSVGIRISYQ